MRAPKKIHPDMHFLEFVKEYFHRSHKEMHELLFENRQQYFDCLAKKRSYNFEAMPMADFAKLLGLNERALKACVNRYLFK